MQAECAAGSAPLHLCTSPGDTSVGHWHLERRHCRPSTALSFESLPLSLYLAVLHLIHIHLSLCIHAYTAPIQSTVPHSSHRPTLSSCSFAAHVSLFSTPAYIQSHGPHPVCPATKKPKPVESQFLPFLGCDKVSSKGSLCSPVDSTAVGTQLTFSPTAFTLVPKA